jgi:hypothetical protein
MLKQTKWLTLGFALVAAVACSSSSSNGGTGGDGTGAGGESSANNATGSVKDYCAESCTKAHGCDKTVDVQTCSNTCKNDFAAIGPKLRDDFLASITNCYGDQDCVAVLDDEALGKCTDEAVAELAPSKEGTSFCSDYEDAAAKCDNSNFDKADCYDQAKTFNDDALKEAEACLTKSCSAIDDCVAATLATLSDIKDIGGGNTTDPGNGTGGNSSGTGGSNSGTAGKSGTAGTGSAGAPLTGACEVGDPSECASATSVNTCIDGTYAVVGCKKYLGDLGFAGNACTGTKCVVGSPNDADCIAGVTAVCTCTTCSDADQLDYYLACHLDDPAGTKDAFMCAAAAATCPDVNACSPG